MNVQASASTGVKVPWTRLWWDHAALLVQSLRITTRLWYDVLVPLAMLAVMGSYSLPWRQVGLVTAALLLFHGGQTLFNDVADVAVDRASTERSRQRRVLVRGTVSRIELLGIGWAMVAGAGVVSVFLPWQNQVVFLVALPLVLAYNFKTAGGLSGRPLATQVFWPLTWVLIYVYSAGGLQFAGWRTGVPYLVFIVMFMGLGEGLCQDIRDIDNDRIGGRVTTPVRFGARRSSSWAWWAFTLSLIPWIWHVIATRMPVTPAAVATTVLVGWIVLSGRCVRRIRANYQKADGRYLHIGSILTFTCVNVLILMAATPVPGHR
ncbi:4-hydroxybenzoate polyprenyltransferase [Mycobacterium sp. MAA66]|uniref:prenyltransferase n=1 Tax=Mycobacterium sp. MAA66 TaxID=3156297 RepID=UPI00351531F2